MSIGICVKGANNLYKGQWIDFFFEFLPQIVIMLALFGYMDMMIIMKWLTDYMSYDKTMYAPSITSTLIDMFLNMGSPTMATDEPLFDSWETQTRIEQYLLAVVGICIPLMLLIKPMAALCAGSEHHDDNKRDQDAIVKAVEKVCKDAKLKQVHEQK